MGITIASTTTIIMIADIRFLFFLLLKLNILISILSVTDMPYTNSERILYMKFPILASVLLFILVLSRSIKRLNRKKEKDEKGFWEREALANSTRRKPLDNLEYITIPLEDLPVGVLADNPKIKEYLDFLKELSQKKIVNLTGFTNTDLKLEYGAPNITALMEYDQNYTLLARTLQQWADILLDAGYTSEAVTIMEFALSTHTDVSRTYYRLAEYYASIQDTPKIQNLITEAKTLRSIHKNTIIRTLRESYMK